MRVWCVAWGLSSEAQRGGDTYRPMLDGRPCPFVGHLLIYRTDHPQRPPQGPEELTSGSVMADLGYSGRTMSCRTLKEWAERKAAAWERDDGAARTDLAAALVLLFADGKRPPDPPGAGEDEEGPRASCEEVLPTPENLAHPERWATLVEAPRPADDGADEAEGFARNRSVVAHLRAIGLRHRDEDAHRRLGKRR